jgi:hypothetical protein
MIEFSEFDYEIVLKSYSIQVITVYLVRARFTKLR